VAQCMTIGSERRFWIQEQPRGDCPECGGQCAPECGYHPLGCFYGGFTEQSAYWLIAEGCKLYHGEDDWQPETPKEGD